MSKVFDWEFAEKQHSKETFEYLKKVHNTPITEDDFVDQYSKLPRHKPRATKVRCPGKARKQYQMLKNKFGFFELNHPPQEEGKD